MLKLYQLANQNTWLPPEPTIRFVIPAEKYYYGIARYQVTKELFGDDYEILYYQGFLSHDGYIRRTICQLPFSQLFLVNPKILMTHASKDIREIGNLIIADILTEEYLKKFFYGDMYIN